MKGAHNNRFESDGLPLRCAPGQAAAQAERSSSSGARLKLHAFLLAAFSSVDERVPAAVERNTVTDSVLHKLRR